MRGGRYSIHIGVCYPENPNGEGPPIGGRSWRLRLELDANDLTLDEDRWAIPKR